MLALDAGPLDQMREKHDVAEEPKGFLFLKKIKTSVVFKPKHPKKI